MLALQYFLAINTRQSKHHIGHTAKKFDYKFMCTIACDDLESELEYKDVSKLDVSSSFMVGLSLTTTQSLASVQNGDMEIIWHLQLKNQLLKNNNQTLGEKNKVLPVPNSLPIIISASRYASKDAKELCLVIEVYSLLPDHLHHFIPASHFQSLLEQRLQGGHSGEIGKLYLMAGCIFGLDLSYFDLSFMK
ncbi:uncharacterized protein F5147DRAFT_649880 [Suillus discolor]|uniref:Uncharacterized protein n=1 Tax=Suillus discolor TaxID=1912936 RepID=A0A9P7FEW2_9AGAM|nr:uncharacterized protein F5147DRAFT_649880 [Suillus discolor]KAG2114725.1 hypothetical protein F5147DRAFT_649880 [Suillus discolor]